ncbi:MAG TPA: DUF3300 domain-containing protein [Burkholderiales bacterium]|nr:DUF3300 domain-containing protein [Burkholderiales bacterium]
MRWLVIALLAVSVNANARLFHTSELEVLAAPVAMHPDAVVWTVLDASLAPHDAPRTLAPWPDLVAHMSRNPQWIHDLGQAYAGQRNELVAAIQVLRQRASVPAQYIVVQPPVVVVPHAVIVDKPHRHHPHRHPGHPHRGHDRDRRADRHPNGPPSPAVRMQQEQAQKYRQYHNVPESQRQPIVPHWGQPRR